MNKGCYVPQTDKNFCQLGMNLPTCSIKNQGISATSILEIDHGDQECVMYSDI